MLAGTYGDHTGNEALRHGIAADAVASAKDGERAQGMQGTTQTAERFPPEGQTGAQSRLQPVVQGVQMGVQPLPAHTWIETCQRFCGKEQTSATLLSAILPPFLQLEHQIIDLLLQRFDHTLWFP